MEANQKALIWEWSKVEPRREQNLAMFGSKVLILGGTPVLIQNPAILTQKPLWKTYRGHHSQGPRGEFHGKHAQLQLHDEYALVSGGRWNQTVDNSQIILRILECPSKENDVNAENLHEP